MRDVEEQLKALMIRGLDGDVDAHSQMLSALSGFLRAYFNRRLGAGASDSEDLVQETLLAIHLKRETYDRSLPFTPWAYTIARYKMLDRLRRTRSQASAPLEEADALFASENPEEGAVRRDLDKLLATLPPRQRALIEQVKLVGFSMEEAAHNMGMSVSAVKVTVHRAVKALARKVSDADR